MDDEAHLQQLLRNHAVAMQGLSAADDDDDDDDDWSANDTERVQRALANSRARKRSRMRGVDVNIRGVQGTGGRKQSKPMRDIPTVVGDVEPEPTPNSKEKEYGLDWLAAIDAREQIFRHQPSYLFLATLAAETRMDFYEMLQPAYVDRLKKILSDAPPALEEAAAAAAGGKAEEGQPEDRVTQLDDLLWRLQPFISMRIQVNEQIVGALNNAFWHVTRYCDALMSAFPIRNNTDGFYYATVKSFGQPQRLTVETLQFSPDTRVPFATLCATFVQEWRQQNRDRYYPADARKQLIARRRGAQRALNRPVRLYTRDDREALIRSLYSYADARDGDVDETTALVRFDDSPGAYARGFYTALPR